MKWWYISRTTNEERDRGGEKKDVRHRYQFAFYPTPLPCPNDHPPTLFFSSLYFTPLIIFNFLFKFFAAFFRLRSILIMLCLLWNFFIPEISYCFNRQYIIHIMRYYTYIVYIQWIKHFNKKVVFSIKRWISIIKHMHQLIASFF